MKQLLILFFICIYHTADSQYLPLIEDDKLWSFSFESYCPYNDCNAPHTLEYRINGQTELNGQTYSNLEYRDNLNLNWVLQYYIREENGKVLRYGSTSESVLYDFSLEIGDQFPENSSNPNTVIDIDEIVYAGEIRKILTFDTPSYCYNGYGGYYENEQWIEGIGSMTELAHPFLSNPDIVNCLECVSITNETYPIGSETSGNCFLLSVEDFKSAGFKIAPNPLIDVSKVISSQNITEISIFDIKGKLLKTKYKSNQIRREDFKSSGLYILEIRDSNNTTSIKKIIVN